MLVNEQEEVFLLSVYNVLDVRVSEGSDSQDITVIDFTAMNKAVRDDNAIPSYLLKNKHCQWMESYCERRRRMHLRNIKVKIITQITEAFG